jgi:protein SCO1/2
VVLPSVLLESCSKNLPVVDKIDRSFTLVNQDSSKIVFPDNYRGRITLMSFIYTNCPDICPLTTNNMINIRKDLNKDGIKGVQFLELSFDPDRDTPAILKKYAGIRNINDKDFQFLTGEKKVIDSLLKVMNVYAIPGDTTRFKDGTYTYSFIHSDRITLIDRESRIRKEYNGSHADIEEIVNDIKELD